MLNLQEITLIALTNKDFEGHKKALDKSCEGIEWGAVKIIWDEKIKNIDEWNRKVIYELPNYVDTDFAMLIHADGYVIHPEAWRPEFLDYDYVGAPWPLPTDNFSYRDTQGNLIRVGNSVSLRSRRLLQLAPSLNLPWGKFYGFSNEDGFICCHNRHEYTSRGMRFAPLDVAKFFSREHTIPENRDIEKTFAFHQVDV